MCSDKVTILAAGDLLIFPGNAQLNTGGSPTLLKVVKHELVGLIILRNTFLAVLRCFTTQK